MTKRFKVGKPIVVGLAGLAGSGKTSTADTIVPQFMQRESENLIIDHKFLAMPLYEMANVKRSTEGTKRKDRIYFGIHEVLYDLFGGNPLYGVPPYDEFVKLVDEIASLPIDYDINNKPRTFLQQAGSICRSIEKDVFANWIERKIILDNARSEENWDKSYMCIVSDIRMPNEAEMIKDFDNSVLVRFDASEEVRLKRLMDRDGKLMTPDQANHESEKVMEIPEELFDVILDTDDFTVREQAMAVQKFVVHELENFPYPEDILEDIYAKS